MRINAFITPPGSQGVDLHFDVQDVLVLQITGEKHWQLKTQPLVDPLPQQAWFDVSERRREELRLAKGLLEHGNALVSVAQRGSAVLGALAGATVVTLVGARSAFFVAAAVFMISALTVLRLPDTSPAPGASRSVLADAADGIRAVKERPWVLAVMATVCVHLLTGTATALTLLPIIARQEPGGEPAYGVVLAAMAAGALPAAALASRWCPEAKGLVSMCALVGYSLVPLSLAAPLPLPGVVAAFAVGGFVVELFFVYWLSALQRNIPGAMLGKVLALDQLGAFALLPLGYLLVGPVVGLVEPGWTLVGAGVVVALSSVMCLVVPGVVHFSEPANRTVMITASRPSSECM